MRLTVVSGGEVGAVYEFEDVCDIGRASTCNIQIQDLTVSRLQARITRNGRGFEIQRTGSSTNMSVNDEPLETTQQLNSGDLIRVADCVLRFEREATRGTSIVHRIPESVTVAEDPDPVIQAKIVGAVSSTYSLLDKTDDYKVGEQFERLAAGLKTISAVAKGLSAILDVEELLLEIPSRLIDIFSASRAAILVKDSATGAMIPRAVKRRKQNDKAELKISTTVLKHVTEKREAALSRDAGADARFQGGQSLHVAGVRSVMCAPLIWREELVGAIYLDHDFLGKFAQADLELLVGIADQCATALGIAQLAREITERKLVEQDMQVAQRIQKSFLPRKPPEAPGLTFCTAYIPARSIGGDFYDFFPLSGDRMALVIADISGKGVGAALHMSRVSRDVRFLAAHEADPRKVVYELNKLVLESGNDSMFVTMLYVVIDLKTFEMTIANCGHLPPVLRRSRSPKAQLIEVEPGNPIGLLDDPEFGFGRFQMEEADTILIYTDGLTEAMNPKKELLGTKRILDALSDGPIDPSLIVDRALKLMQQFAAGAPASDDTTLLAFALHQTTLPISAQDLSAIQDPTETIM